MGYSIWEIAKAFIDDHSELTADLYTQAIVVDPNNSELYSDRTQANIKSNNLTGVQTLTNRKEEFCKLHESYKPSLVYLQGEQLENDEVGSCAWRDADLPTAESISNIFPHCLQFPVPVPIHHDELSSVFNHRRPRFPKYVATDTSSRYQIGGPFASLCDKNTTSSLNPPLIED
ncbi:hypothetical protein ABKV19_016747 [Rosa sericea]